jgi:hypothetical protein
MYITFGKSSPDQFEIIYSEYLNTSILFLNGTLTSNICLNNIVGYAIFVGPFKSR